MYLVEELNVTFYHSQKHWDRSISLTRQTSSMYLSIFQLFLFPNISTTTRKYPLLQVNVFWVVTPCSVAVGFRRFGDP